MEQANTLPVGSCSNPEVTREVARRWAEVRGYRPLQLPVLTPAALAGICSSTRPGKRGLRMRVKRPPARVGPGPPPAPGLARWRLRPTHVGVTQPSWLIAAHVPLGHLRRSAATAKPATISSLLAAVLDVRRTVDVRMPRKTALHPNRTGICAGLRNEMRAVVTHEEIARLGTLACDTIAYLSHRGETQLDPWPDRGMVHFLMRVDYWWVCWQPTSWWLVGGFSVRGRIRWAGWLVR